MLSSRSYQRSQIRQEFHFPPDKHNLPLPSIQSTPNSAQTLPFHSIETHSNRTSSKHNVPPNRPIHIPPPLSSHIPSLSNMLLARWFHRYQPSPLLRHYQEIRLLRPRIRLSQQPSLQSNGIRASFSRKLLPGKLYG